MGTRLEDWAWRHQPTGKRGEEDKSSASGNRVVVVAWRDARRHARSRANRKKKKEGAMARKVRSGILEAINSNANFILLTIPRLKLVALIVFGAHPLVGIKPIPLK